MFIGINSDLLNKRFSPQRNSMWCWAASLNMIFRHYGLALPQELIVKRTFGTDRYGFLPNKPGDLMHITSHLNNWGLDRRGKHYTVKSVLMPGAPPLDVIVEELMNQRPVLLSYQSRPRMNHAVVITGAELIPQGNSLVMTTLVVRDPSPYPNNIKVQGRRTYKPAQLLNKATAYWLIRVKVREA
ncbi:MAG: hypothetical protein JNL32_00525 [Candidatus Kapabacteria bacterium]|nr:hypothetical protein [Candidatus Kapabacteria bacterium]